jgi:hypothetical protein
MQYALTILLLASTSFVNAEMKKAPVTEFRRHFQYFDREKVPHYEATVVVRMSEEQDERFVLIHDEGNGDFILSKVWTFGDQRSTSRLSDIKGRTYIQVSYKLPLTGTTRTETMAEARKNPDLTKVPSVVTLETNGGRWEGLETDWDSAARLRDFRRQVRQTIDFSLIETMERMRGTFFATDEGSYFYTAVCRFALYDIDLGDAEPPATVEGTAAAPKCSFDQRFGFPCSEKQRTRVEKADAEKRLLEHY